MARIAILWDWQLWALSALAAQEKWHETMIFWAAWTNSPAAQVSPSIDVTYKDTIETVHQIMGWEADVVTTEWENIPIELILAIEEAWITMYPNSKVLDIIQDRKTEKEAIKNAWEEVVDYITWVNNIHSLQRAFDKLWAGILKTRKEGYDGKWQVSINSQEDINKLLKENDKFWLADRIFEKKEDLYCELSVVVSRRPWGQTRVYEPAHNIHENWILKESIIPATQSNISISAETINKAKEIAENITNEMWVVWLLAVEMFVLKDWTIKINEVAPRPHNSGHWTIESYNFSQYHSHITAILDEDFEELELLKKSHLYNLLWNEIDSLPRNEDWSWYRYYKWWDSEKQVDVYYYVYWKWYGDLPKWRKMWHIVEVSELEALNWVGK